MEEIRSSQTQPSSSAGNATGHESSDDLVSVPTIIDECVIADQILGVRRGYRKGVGRIIKDRRKAPDTPSLSASTRLSEQSAQATEEHRLLREQVYTQRIRPPPPSPPPLPSSDNVEDLRKD